MQMKASPKINSNIYKILAVNLYDVVCGQQFNIRYDTINVDLLSVGRNSVFALQGH